METTVDEIATDIYRLSTWVPDITEHGFTFNQFLLTGDEPFLFHCGQRQLFPLVSVAINRVVPLEKLRWISFGLRGRRVRRGEPAARSRPQRRGHP